jgi:hypothetical protein
MMATEIDICNEALLILGQKTITQFNQTGSRNSEVCATMYSTRRDYLLRMYTWVFAKAAITLGPTGTAPAIDWAYAFNLPTDFIRTRKTDYLRDGTYELQGNQLLADDSSVILTYIKRVTDVNMFDPVFVLALAALLARDMSVVVTGKVSKLAVGLYDQYIDDAANVDAIEDIPQVIQAEEFLESRI